MLGFHPLLLSLLPFASLPAASSVVIPAFPSHTHVSAGANIPF